MRLLALDVGERSVGVAGCDPLGVTTTGLYTIRRQSLERDIEQVSRTVTEREVERVVVGLPISMDDTEGAIARKVRSFASALDRSVEATVVLWDERLSTFEAESILREAGVHWKKRKAVIDQVAAEVILRSYIDAGCPQPSNEGPAFPVSEKEERD